MLRVKFYITTQEIVREQEVAVKGVYTQSVDMSQEPLAGSKGELLLLKVKLLMLELKNPMKTQKVRSSTEYYNARQEAVRLNKSRNAGKIVCEYCKSICNDNKLSVLRYTVDHVVPLSEGGDGTDQSNLKIACRFCNRLKGSLAEDVFLKLVKAGKRDAALADFNDYVSLNGLEATHEVLSDFIKNRKKYMTPYYIVKSGVVEMVKMTNPRYQVSVKFKGLRIQELDSGKVVANYNAFTSKQDAEKFLASINK